jgi:hypothetical protein
LPVRADWEGVVWPWIVAAALLAACGPERSDSADAPQNNPGCVPGVANGTRKTCQPPLAWEEGAECWEWHCGTEFYCAGDTSTSPGTCRRLPVEGEECGNLDGDELGVRCAAGLYCTSTRMGLCLVPAGNGEPCTHDLACSAGLYCDNTPPNGTCRPKLADGALCGREGICGEGLLCELSGRVCRRQLGEGEPCTHDLACSAGLYCDGNPGACRLLVLSCEGAPCVYSADCASGLECR